MKTNIGTVNALIRISCGLTLLAWATARMVRRPYSMRSLLIAAIAATKVGSAITRFCPITYFYKGRF